MRKNFLSVILLLPLLLGCTSSKFVPEEVNFPLTKSKTYSLDKEVLKFGILDSYLIVETYDGVQSIDTSTDKVIWEEKKFQIDHDSDILFTDDYAVMMSYQQILIAHKNGHKKFLNLNPKRKDNIRLVAAYTNYVYVIRGGVWVLEVYDISENRMIWEASMGRGLTQIFYEPSINVAYAVNSSSIRTLNNNTGELLWEYEINANQSTYENGILYIAYKEFDSNKFNIAALNVETHEFLWSKDFNAERAMHIYGLAIFQDKLILTSGDGIFAFRAIDGEFIWHPSIEDAFYTKPVLLNDILYVKTSSKKIYAISFANGEIFGYIQHEPEPSFGVPTYETKSGVYLFKDGIIFKTKNNIEFYALK